MHRRILSDPDLVPDHLKDTVRPHIFSAGQGADGRKGFEFPVEEEGNFSSQRMSFKS